MTLSFKYYSSGTRFLRISTKKKKNDGHTSVLLQQTITLVCKVNNTQVKCLVNPLRKYSLCGVDTANFSHSSHQHFQN